VEQVRVGTSRATKPVGERGGDGTGPPLAPSRRVEERYIVQGHHHRDGGGAGTRVGIETGKSDERERTRCFSKEVRVTCVPRRRRPTGTSWRCCGRGWGPTLSSGGASTRRGSCPQRLRIRLQPSYLEVTRNPVTPPQASSGGPWLAGVPAGGHQRGAGRQGLARGAAHGRAATPILSPKALNPKP
jgi:hypothetical protein